VYHHAIERLRAKKQVCRSDPAFLEYFVFHRIFVDEIHEVLCTTYSKGMKRVLDKRGKDTTEALKPKNRRAGRELLGIMQPNVEKRPLLYRKAMFGLTYATNKLICFENCRRFYYLLFPHFVFTFSFLFPLHSGTPLLDSCSRVTELANLADNVYIPGLFNHWRKLERESMLDQFLHTLLQSKQTRQIRSAIFEKCQEYIDTACCRNKVEKEMDGIELVDCRSAVNMTQEEQEMYMRSQSGITSHSLAITPEDFDAEKGHNVDEFLRQNACLKSRGDELVRICRRILSRKGDNRTKIVVFCDSAIGAGVAAREALDKSELKCTFLEADDSVETKNRKIFWYQSGDATLEDRKRPRVLVLHFDHAAGLNLQTECHDVVLFTPLYVGDGGSTGDAVSDTSTELQAVGRVFRPGQAHAKVYLWRIELRGANGEECLDAHLIRRNTAQENVDMAVNN